MKKIFAISLIAMTAVTSARADIASQAYVDKQDNAIDAKITTLNADASTEGSVAKKIADAITDTYSASDSTHAMSGVAVASAITNAGGQTEQQVSTAISTALANGGDAYQTASDVTTTLGSYYTKTEADTQFVEQSQAATNAVAGIIKIATDTEATTGTAENVAVNPKQLKVVADTAAGGQTEQQVSTAISTALANGGDAYQTASDVTTTLGSYYTKTEADTQFVEQSQAATNAAAGIIKIATDTEATTGTAENVAVNPKQLKEVASAASTAVSDLDDTSGAAQAGKWVTAVTQTDGKITATMADPLAAFTKLGQDAGDGVYALTATATDGNITGYKWELIQRAE